MNLNVNLLEKEAMFYINFYYWGPKRTNLHREWIPTEEKELYNQSSK